jgi:hypothetical protein
MQAVSKILCPVDFSEPSFRRLKTANTLALQYDYKLILLHTEKVIRNASCFVLSVPASLK